jgi:uncharacterized protein (DUF58 family)
VFLGIRNSSFFRHLSFVIGNYRSMIVPQSRLMLWVSVVVLPFAAIAAVVPEAAVLSGLFIAAVVVLALLDAALAQGSLEGIRIELPAVVRLSKDRAGAIEVHIKNEKQQAKRLRLGLPLPREIVSPDADLWTILPAGCERSRFAWPCTPLKRGNYPLNGCHIEAASPWGLWAVRARLPTRTELRVYPNLLTERKSALFLNRGGFGAHAQRQVGQGRDFEKLRDYVHGDSYDEVHWKATAKRGRPVTKVFQIERTQEVYVIIDTSRLSARQTRVAGSGPVGGLPRGQAPDKPQPATQTPPTDSVLERFITSALVLGLAAEQQGDLFGLLTFSDKVQTFVRARNGKAHYAACRDALYTLQPQVVTPDFDELGSVIRLRLRRRALLVFLTSLDDPVLAESFVRNLELICRQHLILVNMLQPPGVRPLFSDGTVASLDEVYEHLGGHLLWHKLRELERVLQRRGVRFSLLENEKLSAQLVTQYLNVKQRQLI